jgi:hypothetical protein
MDSSGLEQILEKISVQVRNLNTFDNEIFIFTGEQNNLKKWLDGLNRISVCYDIPQNKRKLLAYRFSAGQVSEFIARQLTLHPDITWETLSEILQSHFGPITDKHLNFTRLRHVVQTKNESVQIFAERLFSLARESYGNDEIDLNIVQRQLIGFFTDGIQNIEIKAKILRDDPKTFAAAIEIATREEKLITLIKLRMQEKAAEKLDVSKTKGKNDSGMQIKYVKRTKFCSYCKKRGHLNNECRKTIFSLQKFRKIQDGRYQKLYTCKNPVIAEAKSRNNPGIAEAKSRKKPKIAEAKSRKNPKIAEVDSRENSEVYVAEPKWPIFPEVENRNVANSKWPPEAKVENVNRLCDGYKPLVRTKKQCFFCKRFGHFKNDCKQWRTLKGKFKPSCKPKNLNLPIILRSMVGRKITQDKI